MELYNTSLVPRSHITVCTFLLAAILSLAGGCSSGKKHAGPLTPEQMHGERLFHSTCAQCHHPDSEKPLAGPGLAGLFDKKFLPSGAPANDERVRETILHGKRNMPGYSQVFTDSQINDLIAYLHTL